MFGQAAAASQFTLFAFLPAVLENPGRALSTGTMHWPKDIGSPVLDSLHYAIESSRDVRTNYDKIVEVAS